jgi:hypothetical protein
MFLLADFLTKARPLPAAEAEAWENWAFRTLLGIEARNPLTFAQFGEASDIEDPGALTQHAAVTILFVAGDRGGANQFQIPIPREFTAIDNALRSSEHRAAFQLANPILAATHQQLALAYRHQPAILHFAGHGDERSLSLLVDQDLLVSTAPVFAEKLAEVLLNFPRRVRLCVLNTCESAGIAEYLVSANAVDAAIGWTGKLADVSAREFCSTFYGALGDGLALKASTDLAAASSAKVPVLFVNQALGSVIIPAKWGVAK